MSMHDDLSNSVTAATLTQRWRDTPQPTASYIWKRVTHPMFVNMLSPLSNAFAKPKSVVPQTSK